MVMTQAKNGEVVNSGAALSAKPTGDFGSVTSSWILEQGKYKPLPKTLPNRAQIIAVFYLLFSLQMFGTCKSNCINSI